MMLMQTDNYYSFTFFSLHIQSMFSAPVSMFGSGTYSLGSVKEIKITDEFNNLKTEQKQCQTYQSFEECINNQLFAQLEENCGCYPYELSNFSQISQVRFEMIKTHISQFFRLKFVNLLGWVVL